MRLKAPAGLGNPTIGGIEIKPDAKGVYEVAHKTGAHLVEAFGFIDIDAPPKRKSASAPIPAGDGDKLRAAASGALGKFGITATNDVALLAALSDLPMIVDERIAGDVKAAEERVLTQFADENAALKKRAETAEASLADAREVLKAMDEKVAALETKKTGDKSGA